MGPTELVELFIDIEEDEEVLTSLLQLGSWPVRINAMALGSVIGSRRLCNWRQFD